MATIAQLLLLTAASGVQAAYKQGVDVHCIGSRAHAVKYDIEGEPNPGDSLEAIKSAQVSIEPIPSRDSACSEDLESSIDNASKELCWGVNEGATCDAAKLDLPIERGFSCKNCFLGAKAGLFYSLNYSIPDVNSVSVGFRDMHFLGALEVHATPSASKTVKGTKVLKDSKPKTVISKLVGCPVCVRVSVAVAMPTSLDYSLALSGAADIAAGAELDINLGDHFISWDKSSGFKKESTKRSVTMTPVLTGTAKVEADLALNLKSSVQVDVDQLLWYHMDMAPSIPMKFTLHDGWLKKQGSLCGDGDAEFNLSHEADLHISLFGKTHHFHHWGPSPDFNDRKHLHKCIDLPTDNAHGTLVI